MKKKLTVLDWSVVIAIFSFLLAHIALAMVWFIGPYYQEIFSPHINSTVVWSTYSSIAILGVSALFLFYNDLGKYSMMVKIHLVIAVLLSIVMGGENTMKIYTIVIGINLWLCIILIKCLVNKLKIIY